MAAVGAWAPDSAIQSSLSRCEPGEWAVSQGVPYATARSWYRGGILPVPSRKVGGPVLVTADTGASTSGLI
jgi:hypothetical protein